MNKSQQQQTRNQNYLLVNPFKSLPGESNHPILRYSTANTFKHESMKLRVCMELTAQGHHLLTEVRFLNGSRADIFDLSDGIAYEIVNSESEKSIKSKQEKYPCKIIKIEVK